MDNQFPAICRLKNKNDIQAVYTRRNSYRGKRLVFYRAEARVENDGKSDCKDPINDQTAVNRFCFVVSKKCGNAPKRNRIKRVLRDIVRNNRCRIPVGFDYIIQARWETQGEKIKQDDFLVDFETYFAWDK